MWVPTMERLHNDYEQIYKPISSKIYIKELQAEFSVAENTIHEAEELFQILRNDYHYLQEYVSILHDILLENEISFP